MHWTDQDGQYHYQITGKKKGSSGSSGSGRSSKSGGSGGGSGEGSGNNTGTTNTPTKTFGEVYGEIVNNTGVVSPNGSFIPTSGMFGLNSPYYGIYGNLKDTLKAIKK